MNWFDHLMAALGQIASAVLGSAMFAIFAGVLAKHSLEVQAKRTAFLGPMLYAKLPTGIFIYYVVLGISAYANLGDKDVRNAIAALFGLMGPEIILSLALRAAKARGLISDLPAETGNENGGQS